MNYNNFKKCDKSYECEFCLCYVFSIDVAET